MVVVEGLQVSLEIRPGRVILVPCEASLLEPRDALRMMPRDVVFPSADIVCSHTEMVPARRCVFLWYAKMPVVVVEGLQVSLEIRPGRVTLVPCEASLLEPRDALRMPRDVGVM